MREPLTPSEVQVYYQVRVPRLTQRGSEWRGPCPIHDGKNDSFAVDSATGNFHCHSKCQRGGSAVDLEMALTGSDFKTAVVELEAIVGRVTPPIASKSATSRDGEILATYDYVDETGKLLSQVVRRAPKRFTQRCPDGNGGWVWKVAGVRRVMYRLPRVMAADEVLIVEGERDAHTAEALGYTATCNAGGAGKWLPEFGDALAGKKVTIIPDNDEPGRKHAEAIMLSLIGKAKEIRIVAPQVGKDLTDWVSGGASKATIDAAIAAAPLVGLPQEAKKGKENAELPEIIVSSRQLRDLRADCLAALVEANTSPKLFVRGGLLADLRSRSEGVLVINNLTDVELRGLLTDRASFFVETEEGYKPCAPPLYAAKDILGYSDLMGHFPNLLGITEIPVLRPDGTVLAQPGYDPATGLYYAPAPGLMIPSIPEHPTYDDVKRALQWAQSAIGDFPFEYDLGQNLKIVPFDQRARFQPVFSASMANALALMLTPLVRPAISGPTPLALVTAPAPGTGKTLLCELIAAIATGRGAALFSAPSEEEEFRKQITSYLKEGVGGIVIDNVCAPLASAQLSKALTADTWADRILGHTQTVLLPVLCTWLATGNNIRLGGDLPRRCYWIRLDAKVARPHLRSGFRHPNLRRWVRENRGELIGALLTLARAWFAAGKPQLNQIVLGSYESWAEVLGGILGHVGVPGFLGNSGELQDQAEADSDSEANFLQALHLAADGKRFTSGDVHRLCRHEPTASALTKALPPELSETLGAEGVFERRLGRWLAERADRRFGNDSVHVKRVGIMHNTQLWTVVNPGAAEPAVIQ